MSNSRYFDKGIDVPAITALAATGAITDTGNYFTTDTINGALQEVGLDLDATPRTVLYTDANGVKQWVPASRLPQLGLTLSIPVAAGRFNMSWTNATGRKWTFPAGTVDYATGLTPTLTSTAEQPDVTIPVGGGIVSLTTAAWSGNYNLTDGNTDSRLLITLKGLPAMTYLLDFVNCTAITGSLADLPLITNYINLTNCPLITGSLADLPVLTNTLNLSGLTLVTGAYTQVNGANVPTITNFTNTGMSTADIDATLIAYAATSKSSGTFTATGKNRTAASDAAVATLEGRSWTISGITKV